MSGQLSELYARALAQETRDVIRKLVHERDEYKRMLDAAISQPASGAGRADNCPAE